MQIYLLIHIYTLCLSIYMYIHINIRIYTGSFGISACCSLDRDLVVLACRGQAMSLAFNEVHGVVLWGSEVCGQVSGHVCIHTIMCIPSCVFERELVLIKCSVHPISRMMIACITSKCRKSWWWFFTSSLLPFVQGLVCAQIQLDSRSGIAW